MELARRVREIFARERQAQEIRRTARQPGDRARGQQAAKRLLLCVKRALLRVPARAQLADRAARLARLGLQGLQRTVGVGDGDFRCAQCVARLAPVGFPALELAAQRFDARAQRRQVFFACIGGARAACPRRRENGQQERGNEEVFQVLLFPCAATAATRFAISAASPR